jgi:hypothetical protein
MKQPRHSSTTHGFAPTSRLLQSRIRTASESRGFAVTRLLTHWEEIVGEAVARVANPVDISYGRQGLGATLTVLTTGPNAPVLEMQKDQIRERVNACYGYRAISRIRITQTAPTGFAEGQVAFGHAKTRAPVEPEPALRQAAAEVAAEIESEHLRLALEALGTNVLQRQKLEKGKRNS